MSASERARMVVRFRARRDDMAGSFGGDLDWVEAVCQAEISEKAE